MIAACHDTVPPDWRGVLADQLDQPYFQELLAFVARERNAHTIYPPDPQTFAALRRTPFQSVRVLILGQDPYHGEGQAHGLSFSVQPGVAPPPSLVNIFKELRDDLGHPIPDHGFLGPWADQGVLLLNAVLTVRAGQAASHRNRGWERFTDAIIQALSRRQQPLVFVLWGNYARAKRALIDGQRHGIVDSPHPSPLSARRGFFGSRPFSRINALLTERGQSPVDWRLPSRAALHPAPPPTDRLSPNGNR